MGRYDRALERSQAASASNEGGIEPHLIALRSLGRIAWLEGDTTGRDPKARKHYEAALALAGDRPAERAALEVALADYYGATYRLRSALPHLETAEALAQQSGRADVEIRALHKIAETFAQMGELELRSEYRDKALAAGQAAFPDGKLETGPALDAYIEFLDWDISDALRDPDPRPRVFHSWVELDRALGTVFSFGSKLSLSPYVRELGLARRTRYTLNAAVVFGRIGEEETSRALFDRVTADLVDYGGDVSIVPLQNRVTCARAEVEFELGHAAEASQLADACVAGSRSIRDRTALENRMLPLFARIKEHTGELDEADALYKREIVRLEKIRTSIPIGERATFFRGAGRVPWDGLVRVRARQYEANPSDTTLVALLEATDGMRARQLREIEGEAGTRAPDLRAVRERLGSNSVLVSYAFAGDEVVVAALDSSKAIVTRLDADPQELTRQVGQVASAMAEYGPGVGELGPQMQALGKTLLGPVAPLMQGKDRVVVIGDATVNAFPFELLAPSGEALGERMSVAFTPSIQFYERSSPREVADAFYAVGDPIYSEPPESLGYTLGGPRGSSFLRYFTPLPETRTEIEAISGLFGDRATIALGAQATESFVKATPPSRHAFVHFATHGILAGQVPGLAEPALVLGNEPGEDGFLTASEVSSLSLRADLAVLSACSTGAGELLPGEGVMGMGRAFLGAGSRGVVVSLWPVDSAATEALMVRFYTYHLSGLDVSRSLWLAKRDIRAVPQWSHPYFWSAFVLVSEGGLLVDRGDPSAIQAGDVVGGTSPTGDRGFEFVVEPPPGTYREDYSIQDPFAR